MIKSMTGFGNAKSEAGDATSNGYLIEIKAVNSKFLDLSLRLPRDLSDKEFEVRALIGTELERGKISFSAEKVQGLSIQAVVPKSKINLDLFKAYYDQLIEAADYVNAPHEGLFRAALTMPEVMSTEAKTIDEGKAERDWTLFQAVMQEAIRDFNAFRIQEGQMIADRILEYAGSIGRNLDIIEQNDGKRIEQTRNRIKEKLDELQNVKIDQNRFEQELIYYIEKLDIAEEKTRLRNHLKYLEEILANGNGKKIGFICQEIGREINTIGSKVNDAAIQRYVVEMKEELEKIKEQSLNVL
jgi:uncharacterized protein (TIGR00255 family)